MAEAYCNTVHNSTWDRDQNPPLEEIKKAIEWDRTNAEYWYKLAVELMRIRNSEFSIEHPASTIRNPQSTIRNRKACQIEIISALEHAVALNPLEAEYHHRLGWEYTYLWQEPDNYQKWPLAADTSMERAAYFAAENNPYLHMGLGNYWVIRSKWISPFNAEWEPMRTRAFRHYKSALRLKPGREREKMKEQIEEYIRCFYADEKFVRQAIE